MKLPGLVISGVLLLILGGIGGWWIWGRYLILDLPTNAIIGPDKIKASANDPPSIWLVWYGDDTAVYRLRVNAAAYEDLYASLRQALAQDQLRLETIAESDLSATLAPIFTRLSPRIDSFLDNLFSPTASATLLWSGLNSADAALNTKNEPANESTTPTAAQAGEVTRIYLAKEIVTQFRETVLLPSFTLRALRGASGRAFLLVRQDLLENCDRYDRAFRDFVLKTPGTVESRYGDSKWRADPYWQQGNATFLSLCPELRRPNAGQMSDIPLMEAFTAAEETVRAQAMELVRLLTDTSVDMAVRKQYNITTLSAFGLPASFAETLATGKGSISSAWVLAKTAVNQLGGSQGKERFGAGLRVILEGLQIDSIQRLHSVYRNFIAAEVERIGLNLAARSEGVWSKP